MATLKIRTEPGGEWIEVGGSGYILTEEDKQEIADKLKAEIENLEEVAF